MICFEHHSFKKCEEFDGIEVVKRPPTNYPHDSACMGIYEEKPVAVGCFEDGYNKTLLNKVEQFNGPSWANLSDHPK